MKALQRFSISHKRVELSEKTDGAQTSESALRPQTLAAPDATNPTETSAAPPKQPDANDNTNNEPSPVAPAPAAAPTEGTPAAASDAGKPSRPKVHSRSFSLRALLFIQSSDDSPSSPSQGQTKPDEKTETSANSTLSKPPNKRAQHSALVLRTLIVGRSSGPNKSVAPGQLNKVKTQLMQPKSAKQVIAALRSMPATPSADIPAPSDSPCGPIHAVCLPYTEQEAHDLHFVRLLQSAPAALEQPVTATSEAFPSVSDASFDALSTMLKNMDVVNLLLSPDFGIGQPGDGPGLLSGALPTPGTVLNGLQQVTPELLALGFATGQILIPDHRGKTVFSSWPWCNDRIWLRTPGVYPPTDRMSVLTCK